MRKTTHCKQCGKRLPEEPGTGLDYCRMCMRGRARSRELMEFGRAWTELPAVDPIRA